MKITLATLYIAAILFLSYSISQSLLNPQNLSVVAILHLTIRCIVIIAFTQRLFQLFRSPKETKN